jgi:hypothetical protein
MKPETRRAKLGKSRACGGSQPCDVRFALSSHGGGSALPPWFAEPPFYFKREAAMAKRPETSEQRRKRVRRISRQIRDYLRKQATIIRELLNRQNPN